jgi:hypothetical protein
VRLASVSDRIHAAGGEVIAISVDSAERQAAMFRRWPTPHITYVSDPGGERYLQPLDLFDPDERGGIALPALLVIDPEGTERFGYRGDDFADRRHDDDAIAALEGLDLAPIEPPSGGPVDASVDVDQPGAFSPRIFVPYFRGNRFGAHAIFRRVKDDDAKTIAREHRQMCDTMLEAWEQVRPT